MSLLTTTNSLKQTPIGRFRVILKKKGNLLYFFSPFSLEPLAALSLHPLLDAACVSMNGRERERARKGERESACVALMGRAFM